MQNQILFVILLSRKLLKTMAKFSELIHADIPVIIKMNNEKDTKSFREMSSVYGDNFRWIIIEYKINKNLFEALNAYECILIFYKNHKIENLKDENELLTWINNFK